MTNYENLERLLDKGMTLIEARQFDKSLYDVDVKDCEYVKLIGVHYPDDYFEPIHDGVEFFTFDKIGKYKSLPSEGIILKDGTIFNVNTFHMEESCWLKYNGIDLENNLRYVYFRDTKNLSIIGGYDAKKKFNENNVAKLCRQWNEYYENENCDDSVELTEKQAISIFYLCKQFGLKLDDVLAYNEAFRISGTKAWTDNKSRKIGNDNIYTIDHALKKIPTQDLYR